MSNRITISAVRGLLRAEELRLAGYQHRREVHRDGDAACDCADCNLAGAHVYEILRHIHDLRRLVVGKQPRDVNTPR